MFRAIAALIAVVLPWRLKRGVYRLLGHSVDPTARVGLSLILADRVELGPGASIGHLNLILVDRLEMGPEASIRHVNLLRHCDLVRLDELAVIGGLNLVNGIGRQSDFLEGIERHPALILGPHACITYGHFFDTTDTVELKGYSAMAGWGSQVLSHSLDFTVARQICAPVTIEEYAFTGTRVVLLPGSVLPSHSMLGTNSVLSDAKEQSYRLYAGTPAKELQELQADMAWFTREVGLIL
jgi:carbonic anhydrase/acetyltransferase-like protein (isoleucine patch superfamily)